LVVLGFEFGALCFLGRCSTTWTTPAAWEIMSMLYCYRPLWFVECLGNLYTECLPQCLHEKWYILEFMFKRNKQIISPPLPPSASLKIMFLINSQNNSITVTEIRN
jgi:hypothetical protein